MRETRNWRRPDGESERMGGAVYGVFVAKSLIYCTWVIVQLVVQ